jgi:hypothetical protein
MISQQLSLYKDSSGIKSDIMVYLCGDSVLFNSEKAVSYQEFEESIGQGNSFEMSRLFTIINNQYVAAIPIVMPYPNNKQYSNQIIYKVPVPFLENSPTASILFLIRAENILDIILNYIGEFSGYAFIYDNNLKVIYKYDNCGKLDSIAIANDMAKSKGTGVMKYEYGMHKFVTLRMVSEKKLLFHRLIML